MKKKNIKVLLSIIVIVTLFMFGSNKKQDIYKYIDNYSSIILLNESVEKNQYKLELLPSSDNLNKNPGFMIPEKHKPISKALNAVQNFVENAVGFVSGGGGSKEDKLKRKVTEKSEKLVDDTVSRLFDGNPMLEDVPSLNKAETAQERFFKLREAEKEKEELLGKIPKALKDLDLNFGVAKQEVKDSSSKNKNKELEYFEIEQTKGIESLNKLQEKLSSDIIYISKELKYLESIKNVKPTLPVIDSEAQIKPKEDLDYRSYYFKGEVELIENYLPIKSDPIIMHPLKPEPITGRRETINSYMYVIENKLTVAGPKAKDLTCGDLVYVTTCTSYPNYITIGGSLYTECDVRSVNNVPYITKIAKGYLNYNKPTPQECGINKYYAGADGATYYTKENSKTLKTLPCGTEIIIHGSLLEACHINMLPELSVEDKNVHEKVCKAEFKNETIYVQEHEITKKKPSEETCNATCETSKALHKQSNFDPIQLKICYEKRGDTLNPIDEDEYSIFTCQAGFDRVMKEEYAHNTCTSQPRLIVRSIRYKESTQKKSSNICSKTFSYSCERNKTTNDNRPKVGASGSYVATDNFGTITISGTDSISKTGLKGFRIWTHIMPTIHDNWIPFDNANYQASSRVRPGVYFVSVMTNDNVMSYPIMVTVRDNDVSTTANIFLKNPDGSDSFTLNPLFDNHSYSSYDTIKDSKYMLLNNNFKKESVFANGFDLLTNGYEVTVEANKIAVFATLTSDDASYVDGFGPRTVDLNYGRNIILVKIKNKEGNERTYTFIVNRTDNRDNYNLITEITTSVGDISFNRYVSDYTIEVPKDTKKVDVDAKLTDITASFVKDFEPRTVELKDEVTSIIIKTISEAKIVRSYVLTFVKKGVEVETSIDDSVNLSSLTLTGFDLKFDKDVTSYNITVPYETENIEINAFPESKLATIDYISNFAIAPGQNNLEITVTNNNMKKVYNVFINRKEPALDISSNTKLKTLTVQDYNLNFNPEVKDYKVKIKNEKTLLLTATPESDRSEVYMYGNNDLTAYSTVRIKVIAEDGTEDMYSVDIVKALFNKEVEIVITLLIGASIVAGGITFVILRRRKQKREYLTN